MMGLPPRQEDLTTKEKIIMPFLFVIMFTIGPYLAYIGLLFSQIPKLEGLDVFEGDGCLHLIASGIILFHVGLYIDLTLFPQYPFSVVALVIIIIGSTFVVEG